MRCPKCNGAKKISDLGFVKKQCPECLGVGHVKDEPVIIADDIKSGEVVFTTLEKKTAPKSKLTETIQELGA